VHRWRGDPEFRRYLGGPTFDHAATEAALDAWQRHWREHGFGQVAVEERASGELIGRSGVSYHAAWPDDPEVGWAFDPAVWNRGFATEAGAACVAWGFGELGFRRLVSITVEENLASRRVMEKLGFTFLTVVRDPERGDELWVHSLDSFRAEPTVDLEAISRGGFVRSTELERRSHR
jgi:RimJ/RimL family protein N-acetyltransferase